jgi:hypothetical protein
MSSWTWRPEIRGGNAPPRIRTDLESSGPPASLSRHICIGPPGCPAHGYGRSEGTIGQGSLRRRYGDFEGITAACWITSISLPLWGDHSASVRTIPGDRANMEETGTERLLEIGMLKGLGDETRSSLLQRDGRRRVHPLRQELPCLRTRRENYLRNIESTGSNPAVTGSEASINLLNYGEFIDHRFFNAKPGLKTSFLRIPN